MKNGITLLLFLISITFFALNYNIKKGFIANGYDVVSYFDQKVEKGNKEFIAEFDSVKFKFSSKTKLSAF